jgi:hypothetical protein
LSPPVLRSLLARWQVFEQTWRQDDEKALGVGETTLEVPTSESSAIDLVAQERLLRKINFTVFRGLTARVW